MFDANAFMNTAYDQASATQSTAVPEGEYRALITKVVPREVKTKNGEDQTVVDVYWQIDDPSGFVMSVTGREKNTARQTLFLDLTPEGNLDMGKGMNAALGRLREAVLQNQPGQPWAFGKLLNQVATISVKHSMQGDKVFANVVAVRALS